MDFLSKIHDVSSKNKEMKKLYSIFVAVLILCGVLLGTTGCANRAPKLEEIYDRVVELIEDSYELNEIFFGEGLPYYDRELPVYESLYSDFTTIGYTKDYNIVSAKAKYHSVDEIKRAAEEVYSSALLEETVYPSIFDGLMQQNAGSGSTYLQARYIEDNNDLYILRESDDAHHPTPLIFDYATMKIIRPSNASRVILTLNAWEHDSPDNVFEMRLTLANEDGVWLLDKLTV